MNGELSTTSIDALRHFGTEILYRMKGRGGHPAPLPHSHRTRWYTYAQFPITRTPLSQEKDIPPISGIGYDWQLQKTPPFPGFLGKSSRDNDPKMPPFPRKWEYACGPSCIRVGGGGALGSYYVNISAT